MPIDCPCIMSEMASFSAEDASSSEQCLCNCAIVHTHCRDNNSSNQTTTTDPPPFTLLIVTDYRVSTCLVSHTGAEEFDINIALVVVKQQLASVSDLSAPRAASLTMCQPAPSCMQGKRNDLVICSEASEYRLRECINRALPQTSRPNDQSGLLQWTV